MIKKVAIAVKIIVGIGLLFGGVALLRSMPEAARYWRVLPYLCIGVGCGLFGHGVGDWVSRMAVRKHPDVERQIEIEQKDERNITVGNRAKAKAFDLMVFVFGALMLAFALMEVDLAAVLLLVFAYLFVIGSGVYYRIKYDKEM